MARVVEALRTQPSGSLRAVAAAAAVSPETVRLVRMNFGAGATAGRWGGGDHCS